MISVAAELAEMHPQTLRMYEQRGLIEPKRSPKGTRLYSHEDVERLRRIQQMTAELGLNLAGVEKVLELEEQLERTRRRVAALERRRGELEAGDRGARGPPRGGQGGDRPLRGGEGLGARARERHPPLHDPDRAALAGRARSPRARLCWRAVDTVTVT